MTDKIAGRIAPGPDGARIVSSADGETRIRIDGAPIAAVCQHARAKGLRGILAWAEAELEKGGDQEPTP